MKFTAHTMVFRNHEPIHFSPGDAVPDWATDIVGEHITTDIDPNTVIVPVPVPSGTTQDTADPGQTPATDQQAPALADSPSEPTEEQEAPALADSPSEPTEEQEAPTLADDADGPAEDDLDDSDEDESPAADDDVPDFTQPAPRRRASTRRKG